MIEFKIVAHFGKPGYIAHPYWPEMARLIDIQKQSGVNRAKSEANRRKALEEYLSANKMTLADYTALQTAAARPFHTDAAGLIIIPADKVLAFLVNVTDMLRAASRPCSKSQIRSRIRATDWSTPKTAPDGVWQRFAVVSAGTGQKLSNQRGFRSSSYIENFDATGSLSIDPEFVKPSVLENAVRDGGANVGIGASRSMGWGRFTVTEFVET